MMYRCTNHTPHLCLPACKYPAPQEANTSTTLDSQSGERVVEVRAMCRHWMMYARMDGKQVSWRVAYQMFKLVIHVV